jgi:hypothetical protein
LADASHPPTCPPILPQHPCVQQRSSRERERERERERKRERERGREGGREGGRGGGEREFSSNRVF